MDPQGLIEGFRENAVVWMLLMCCGILYWAFRPRFRRPPNPDGSAATGPGGEARRD